VESCEDVAGAYWGIRDFPGFINNGNIGYGQSYSVFEHFRRGYLVIETKEYGYVAMVPVGLDTIGSVVFEDNFKKVTPANPVSVSKGEKMGHFAYGGSLVITLIEQGIYSFAIPQGQQIGVFKQKKSSASK
jgi:phosphatidylserine decarboxylase